MTTSNTYSIYRITATRDGQDVASGETLGDCYGRTYSDRDEAQSHADYLQAEAEDPDDLCHGVHYAVEATAEVQS